MLAPASLCFSLSLAASCASPPPAAPPATATAPPAADAALAALQRDARALEPLVSTPLARAFLRATESQPHVTPRVVWVNDARREAWSDDEAAQLPPETKARLQRRELDASFYWETRYGSPLSYVRALEVLARAGLAEAAGKRVVDFGYGTIGQLRLLATMGADATGVDVDPLLGALYSQAQDQGPVGRGRVSLVTGRWPALSRVRDAVGGGVDVFLSKNTLKRGYVHPALAVHARRHFDLGVDDGTFLAALRGVIVPGGLALLYNVCPHPAPPGEPYVPWADGRSPFDRSAWESAGFEVLELDRDDTAAMRAVARVLRWDKGEDAVDIDADVFATYTLARRRFLADPVTHP
jgi:hypothetical protein